MLVSNRVILLGVIPFMDMDVLPIRKVTAQMSSHIYI